MQCRVLLKKNCAYSHLYLQKSVGSVGKVGFSKAMSNGWIALDKTHPEGPRVVRKVDVITDEVKELLAEIEQGMQGF